jgi:diguanylate cyclase (GGDEF)-like protein
LPVSLQVADLFDDPLRRAASLSYMLLKEADPARLRERIVEDTRRLFQADVVRLFEPTDRAGLELVQQVGSERLPESAHALEWVLAAQALVAEKSLLSTHPRLYPELRPFADDAEREGVTTHALLIRAHSQTLGVVCVHWLRRQRPGYEERDGVYLFWDNVGLAVALSKERRRIEEELERLERLAHFDELTGLPNQLLLKNELQRRLRPDEPPVTLLYVDFDGMREANNSPLGFEDGGDVLIRTVGQAIPQLLADGELAARVHRAGDEFACLLKPGADGPARAADLEQALDRLDLPDSHKPFYRGASVGHASSVPDDTAETLIARAAENMHTRKRQRRRT